jgi:nitrate reductase NapAB chaperone NapD
MVVGRRRSGKLEWMHYSGILVVARPQRVAACRQELESLPGVEVHYSAPELGRLVVVLETADVEGQERGLRRIQELPEVELAALVEHRIDDEAEIAVAAGAEREGD